MFVHYVIFNIINIATLAAFDTNYIICSIFGIFLYNFYFSKNTIYVMKKMKNL
jgi:hypothetical protein